MPSSLTRFGKARSIKNQIDALRGNRYQIVPDFIVPTRLFAAADLTGANSGFWVFAAPADMWFLGAQFIWLTAGTNNLRVKKVLSAATGAPGAAADANNVDISANLALTGTANILQTVNPVTTYANFVAEGDKIAIASSAGTASLAGALGWLRFAFD